MTTEDIKYLRETAQVYIFAMNDLARNEMQGREISLAITSGQEARHFMGEMLKEKDVKTPYPDSKDSSNDKIEPPSDMPKTYEISPDYAGMGVIAKIKHLRALVTDQIIEKMKPWMFESNEMLFDLMTAYSLIKFQSSCHWLGECLGKIREKEKSRVDIAEKASQERVVPLDKRIQIAEQINEPGENDLASGPKEIEGKFYFKMRMHPEAPTADLYGPFDNLQKANSKLDHLARIYKDVHETRPKEKEAAKAEATRGSLADDEKAAELAREQEREKHQQSGSVDLDEDL
jgi:hypothetical protein